MQFDKIIETIYYKIMNLKMSYECVCQFIAPHTNNFLKIRFHLIDNFVIACAETICSLTRNGKLNFKSLIKNNKRLIKEFNSIIDSDEYKKILEIRNSKIAHINNNKNIDDLRYIFLNFKLVLEKLIHLLELCKNELKIKDDNICYYTQKDFEEYHNELSELCDILFNNWSTKLHKEVKDSLKKILTNEEYKMLNR